MKNQIDYFDAGFSAAELLIEDGVLTFCSGKIASGEYYQWLNGWDTYVILTKNF